MVGLHPSAENAITLGTLTLHEETYNVAFESHSLKGSERWLLGAAQ